MAAAAIFVGTPKSPSVRISTANTARDGTGTLGTVATAGASGAFYKGLRVQFEATSTANVIRIYIQDAGAGNNELRRELLIPATTPSTTIEAASAAWFPEGGFVLSASSVVKASINTSAASAEIASVSLEGGGDY